MTECLCCRAFLLHMYHPAVPAYPCAGASETEGRELRHCLPAQFPGACDKCGMFCGQRCMPPGLRPQTRLCRFLQSGGVYDLRVSAPSNDSPLHDDGVIVVSLGKDGRHVRMHSGSLGCINGQRNE